MTNDRQVSEQSSLCHLIQVLFHNFSTDVFYLWFFYKSEVKLFTLKKMKRKPIWLQQ